MRKIKVISFSLIIVASMLAIGCSSAKVFSSTEKSRDIGIVKPESEKFGALEEQLNFEEVVKGKVWYTKLQGEDAELNKLYQIKLQFNTTSKTFVKETYKLERYGRTNSYKTAGYTSQKGNYFYGEDGQEILYELTQDYNVNANSSRMNNTIDKTPKSVTYSVESKDIINWDGEKYYEKNALENYSIGNFTTQREVTLD